MGYYTVHKLVIVSGDDYMTDYESEIKEESGYGDSLFNHEVKWYDYEKDMLLYSKKHPKVVFLIEGEGEDREDIWRAYFKNGRNYRIKGTISFEEFSEDKLV